MTALETKPDSHIYDSGTIQLIPLELLIPSPHHTRKKPTFKSVAGLALNIHQNGMIQPIVVRQHPEAMDYEIVAGVRRHKALEYINKEAMDGESVTHAPCIVVDKAEDADAAAVTYSENTERLDLDVMETAKGVMKLYIAHDGDSGLTAMACGKTAHWVRLHVTLATELIKEWADAGKDPNSFVSKWGSGKLALIARCPEKLQALLWDQVGDRLSNEHFNAQDLSTGSIQHMIDERLRVIDQSIWYKHDTPDYIHHEPNDHGGQTVSCPNCQLRTGANPTLWEDMTEVEDGDTCLDRICYDAKDSAFFVKLHHAAFVEHGNDLLKLTRNNWSGERDILCKSEWKAKRPKEKGWTKARGIHVDGELRGTTVTCYIRAPKEAPKPPTEGKEMEEAAASQVGEAPKASPESKADRIIAQRIRWAVEHTRSELHEIYKPEFSATETNLEKLPEWIDNAYVVRLFTTVGGHAAAAYVYSNETYVLPDLEYAYRQLFNKAMYTLSALLKYDSGRATALVNLVNLTQRTLNLNPEHCWIGAADAKAWPAGWDEGTKAIAAKRWAELVDAIEEEG